MMDPINITEESPYTREWISTAVKFILVALLGIAAALLAGCRGNVCVLGTCGDQSTNTAGPSAVQSPTASPSASATPPALPDPCDPDAATLKFHAASSDDKDIAPNATRQLDFTPTKDDLEIPKSCNTKRWPDWTVETMKVLPSSQSVCVLTSTFHSYIPNLTASNRTGDRCLVKGSLSVASGDKVTKHEAVFEAQVR